MEKKESNAAKKKETGAHRLSKIDTAYLQMAIKLFSIIIIIIIMIIIIIIIISLYYFPSMKVNEWSKSTLQWEQRKRELSNRAAGDSQTQLCSIRKFQG